MGLGKSKASFIVVIGSDGAILTLVDTTQQVKRFFAVSPDDSGCKAFDAILQKNPDVPIYILLDTMEQSYTKQLLPAVGSLSIGKLVKKRLERDFAETDIKGAIFLERSSGKRKDWVYMFASTPSSDALESWLDYFICLPNKFMGTFMLPVEMESFVKALNHSLHIKNETKDSKTQWQFIVTHNKTGGFRQVILHKERVIFTRLVRPGKEVLPDIIAGNIEQEVINTTDYLRRLSLGDDEAIEIILIVSKEIKKSLESTEIRGQELTLFTPNEVAVLLGLDKFTNENDKFSDSLISAHFMGIKPILQIHNNRTFKIKKLIKSNSFASFLATLIVPCVLILGGFLSYQLFKINESVTKLRAEKVTLEKQGKKLEQGQAYSNEFRSKVGEVATLVNILDKSSYVPFDSLHRLKNAHQSYTTIDTINWGYQSNLSKSKTTIKESLSSKMDFYDVGETHEERLSNFNNFTKKIKDQFDGYVIQISDPPKRIGFGVTLENIEVLFKADKTFEVED